MTEVPTTEWSAEFDGAQCARGRAAFSCGAIGKGNAWRRIPGFVRHVFTHFPLELSVHAARLPARTRAPAGMRWVALEDVADEALPSLMRKVLAHARAAD